MIVDNTLTGPVGEQVSDALLTDSGGEVTILGAGARAVYDTTHTIYDQPTIRLSSGPHRGATPRLRVDLPASGPWTARWYMWVPTLQDAGHGIGEVRSAATFPDIGWVVHATAAGNAGTRLHLPDLAAPALVWDTQDGSAVTIGQWWRVELQYAGGTFTSRVYPGHATTGARIHVWENLPDPGRTLDVTGYRWRRDRPLLQWGDQGAAVTALQNELIDLGYRLGPWGADGDFGQSTHNAVMEFQTDQGITPVDGAAGPETRAAMDMAGGLVPPPLWVSHLAVVDTADWIGPAEEPQDDESPILWQNSFNGPNGQQITPQNSAAYGDPVAYAVQPAVYSTAWAAHGTASALLGDGGEAGSVLYEGPERYTWSVRLYALVPAEAWVYLNWDGPQLFNLDGYPGSESYQILGLDVGEHAAHLIGQPVRIEIRKTAGSAAARVWWTDPDSSGPPDWGGSVDASGWEDMTHLNLYGGYADPAVHVDEMAVGDGGWIGSATGGPPPSRVVGFTLGVPI